MLRTVVAGILACLSVHSAEAQQSSATMSPAEQAAFLAGAPSRMAEAEAKVRGMSDDEIVARMRDTLANRTHMILQEGHGIYLEFTNADGELFMWYPGNTSVVAGTWGIVNSFSPPRACFKYTKAYHGVTGEYEPNECVAPAQVIGRPYDLSQRNGDPFNLSSGQLPSRKTKADIPAWPSDIN